MLAASTSNTHGHGHADNTENTDQTINTDHAHHATGSTGTCACDPGWMGDSCSLLDFLPAQVKPTPPAGLRARTTGMGTRTRAGVGRSCRTQQTASTTWPFQSFLTRFIGLWG